jgi:hypothetical protein
MGVLKDMDSAMIQQKIRNETIPIIIADYRVWPIASIIGFTLFPWERRIVFLAVLVSLGASR